MKQVAAFISHLRNLEVFSRLRDDSKNRNDPPVPSDLLDIFEQFLFFWDFKEQAVHAINLNYESSGRHGAEYQTLLLTRPPLGPVGQLLVSPSGQRLTLVGPGGVTVAELPARWGKHGLYEGGKDRLTCTSRQLAERFFLCTKHVRVTKVRWHPESPADCHLVVLCSDNYLRVYDVSVDLQAPSHVVALGATHSASLSRRAGATFVGSLGEVAVSFAFGPRPPPAEDKTPEEPEPLPVFVLRGNGDIYATSINVMAPRERYEVHGPVSMLPAADDNYGTDACDLLCLGACPPLLVVATPSRLYHCVVLSRPADDVDDGVGSEASWSRFSSCFSLEPAVVSLYVYESVEPDLVLAPGEDDDPMTSPVRLHRDPASECRYFCSHAAGVHAVALPLIPALEKFASQPDNSEEPLGEHECIVEHLVCTRTVASSPSCPVIGLAVVPHPLLMVVLLASHEVLLLPLVAKFRPALPAAGDEAPVGPAQESGEPFEEHVRRLLERSASLPVLRSAAEPAPARERLELLSRAAGRLRTEYVQRQELARHALQLRADALRRQLAQQRRDVALLLRQRAELSERATETAIRYEDLQANHQLLQSRVEAVFQKCQCGIPVLSDAEKAASRELEEFGDVSLLSDRLQALRAKLDYQTRQENLQRVNEQRRDRQLTTLSAAQRSLLHAELAAQGDQIAALVRSVQAARKTLGL